MPINRLFNLENGEPSDADEVDAELDQILAFINGLESTKFDKTGGAISGAVQFGAGLSLLAGDALLFQAPSAAKHAVTKEYVDALIATASINLVPTGSILPYAGAGVPTHWLLCDGQAVSRTTYAALFAIISTFYGLGDGTTTFNVPDFRGRFMLGENPAGGPDEPDRAAPDTIRGEEGGEREHILTEAEIPSHAHEISNPIGGGSGIIGLAGTDSSVANSQLTSMVGDGDPHNNMPPYDVVRYIIKV